MGTKLSKITELGNILSGKEKTESGIFHFSKQFNIDKLLRPLAAVKQQGISLTVVLVSLIFCRLQNMSVYAAQQLGSLLLDDNTMYRLMNNPKLDWKSILLLFAFQFITCTSIKGEVDKTAPKCFIIDDTDTPKCGKTFEGISKIYSHKEHRFLFGFKLLLVCYWDGKSLLPCCLSLHRESKDKDYGLSKKEQKRQVTITRKEQGYSQEHIAELDADKISTSISHIKRCVSRGIIANYILMDSWFVTDTMLKEISTIGDGTMRTVGMCKMDKRKFTIGGKEYNSQAIIRMKENGRMVRSNTKYKSRYFVVDAIYKGTPVRLFYIKYKNAKTWTLLLTTDLSLSFTKTMQLYQIRWTIEVLFKECKQYLRLGKAQNVDLMGQIADASLAMITYLILSLYKRFEEYETMGALFRETQQEIIQRTLLARIEKVVIKVLHILLEILSIDVNDAIYRVTSSDQVGSKLLVMLQAVSQEDNET